MSEELKQEEHFVAFLDILGYSEVVTNANLKESTEYFEKVEKIMSSISSGKFSQVREDMVPFFKYHSYFTCQYKLFSDNILISVKCSSDNLINCELFLMLSFLLIGLQNDVMAHYGLLLRGGISKGLFVQSSVIAYGEALVNSHDLEQKAIYPRVIIESSIIKEVLKTLSKGKKNERIKCGYKHLLSMFILSDNQNYFLNCFLAKASKNNFENKQIISSIQELSRQSEIQEIWSVDPMIRIMTSKRLKEIVKKDGNYEKLKTIQRVQTRHKVILKLLWLLEYFNISLNTYGNLSNLCINYQIINDPIHHLPKIVLLEDEQEEQP